MNYIFKYVIDYVIKILNKISGKRFEYFKPKAFDKSFKTAVKSDLGFWYVGNVLDRADISFGILNNGVVESDGTELVKRLLDLMLKAKDKIIFYDIGANTGYYGILAACHNKEKIFTVSFEPIAEFAAVIKESIYLNRIENNLKVFNLALGASDAEAEIALSGSGSSIKSGFLGEREEALQKRKITVKKLDGLVEKENLPVPDFIKIDVEGSELDVLMGADNILKTVNPIVWYESALNIKQNKYHNPDFWKNAEYLEMLGYSVFLCQGSRLVDIRRCHITDGTAMYLAVHKNNHTGLINSLDVRSLS